MYDLPPSPPVSPLVTSPPDLTQHNITGDWCRCITRLALLKGSSARSLYSLQLLQPLLTQPHLTHLTLQGFKLNQQGDCHARHLVAMLVQHCPLLEHLDLQVTLCLRGGNNRAPNIERLLASHADSVPLSPQA